MTDFLWKLLSSIGFARPENKNPNVTSGESIPLQSCTNWSGGENAAIHRLARVVFGLGEDEIRKWPGYQMFIQHIRTQLHDTGSLWLEPAIPRTVCTETTTPSFSEYLDFISDISELIQNSTTNNFSIDDLVDQLIKRQKRECLTPGSKESVVYRQALFCVLAWVTLLLDIPPAPSERHFQAIFPDDIPHTQATRLLSDAQRPVHALFKSLCQGKLPDSSRNQTTHEADQWFDLIHVSSVSYSMLYEFGKVAIEWTTSMTGHLHFDASTRTLYLFRLPTYCALGCVHSSQDCVFDRLMQHYFDGSGERHNNVWLRYRQEVLLSYRILFGHDKKSRRMFRQLQKNDETTLSDPLLGVLCGERSRSSKIQSLPGTVWPRSCRNFDNKFQKQDEYSISTDLPLLGPRLRKIQEFNLRQRPRNFWAFWNDTRDKPKWYTFWIVLIVGALALVLGIIQIGLSAAQLVVSIH